jgi:hypothetical protein
MRSYFRECAKTNKQNRDCAQNRTIKHCLFAANQSTEMSRLSPFRLTKQHLKKRQPHSQSAFAHHQEHIHLMIPAAVTMMHPE